MIAEGRKLSKGKTRGAMWGLVVAGLFLVPLGPIFAAASQYLHEIEVIVAEGSEPSGHPLRIALDVNNPDAATLAPLSRNK